MIGYDDLAFRIRNNYAIELVRNRENGKFLLLYATKSISDTAKFDEFEPVSREYKTYRSGRYNLDKLHTALSSAELRNKILDAKEVRVLCHTKVKPGVVEKNLL